MKSRPFSAKALSSNNLLLKNLIIDTHKLHNIPPPEQKNRMKTSAEDNIQLISKKSNIGESLKNIKIEKKDLQMENIKLKSQLKFIEVLIKSLEKISCCGVWIARKN